MSAVLPGELARLAAAGGIALPPGGAEKLALHASEMLRWNRSIRLTAITRPSEVAVKHVLDSLVLVRFAPFPGRTLDFGSGAGYPGIPLAVALPESRLVLLESSAKKCAFLSHAVAALGLRNAEVVRGRMERRAPLPIGPFDQIVTRATVSPAEAIDLLRPYLAPGGRLFLMTGPGGKYLKARSGKADRAENGEETGTGRGPKGVGAGVEAEERTEGKAGVKKGSTHTAGREPMADEAVGAAGAGDPAGSETAAGGMRLLRRERFSLPAGMGEREIAVYVAADDFPDGPRT